MRWITLFICLSLLLFCTSCCVFKKTKTTTTTTETYQVDTIVQVRIDTVVKTVTGYIYDTVIVENKVAAARTYFDITKQRVVLELKGKSFGVPVVIDKVVEQTVKQVDIKRSPPYVLYAILFILFIFVLYIFSKSIDKYLLL